MAIEIDPVQSNLPRANALNLRRKIKAIAKQKVEIDLEFCRHVFYSKVAYVDVGSRKCVPFYEYCSYDSWEDYIEKEVRITTGKAKRYAAVYSKYFIELEGVFDPVKHGIDITKLELLLPIVDENNLDSLIDQARVASKTTLQQLLGRKKQRHTITIKVLNDQKWRKAMDCARMEFGDMSDSELFMKILERFVQDVEDG